MENIFLGFLALMTVFYFFRYWWVKFQCNRAIGYASYLSNDHIYKCAEAFISIERSELPEEQKYDLRAEVRKVLNKSEVYWREGYEKDFDYNKLWLDGTKWTLKQMFPTLTNMKGLEVIYK